MKPTRLVPIVVFSAIIASSCDQRSDTNTAETAKQLAALEQKAEEALARQQELEREIEEREIAAERDAIERERLEIEEARLDMERLQDEAAAAESDRIRQREMELATREGKLEQLQYTLEERHSELQQQGAQLSERDRELAGREAIAINNEQIDEDPAPAGDYGMFYDSLSSYGSWFETPDYGYVWQPVIVRDVSWRPYTRGRWACSDHGWTWISDEPFGWATYHYGRWALCKGRGWIWVPGSQWAPSWVSWRSSSSHIGWAPLPPETLAYAENRWDSNVDATFGIGASWFCFVETRYFGNSIHHHCLPFDRNPIFIQQTVNITHIHVRNRRVICGGPTYGDVSKQVDRQLPFYLLEMERGGTYGDSQSMRPRIAGGKLRVKAPNLDVAWNHGIKPKLVRGSIDEVRIERSEALRPEITERFRQNRQEERQRAVQTITALGGEEKFRMHRARELANNRQAVDKRDRSETPSRETATRPNPAARPSAERPSAQRPPAATPPQEATRPDRAVRNPDRDAVAAADPKRPGNAANRATPTKPSNPGPADNPVRAPRAQAATPTQPGNAPSSRVNRFNNDPAANREPPRAVNRPATRNAPEPESTMPGRNNVPQVADDAPRVRRQQEEQAESARQQQLENQREQARQQQAEAQREQARLRQEAAERQQQQARQQQMEALREQARQQQQEAQREQASQEQMEQSRREQARQQQMEESRREQARQQQQEESRREQARQQQQESERQQERARQQRDEEERGRGRNR